MIDYTYLMPLFHQARAWRLEHRKNNRKIEAAAAAIRESAILDCMVALGMDKMHAKELEKIT